jgi:hypothetical protein
MTDQAVVDRAEILGLLSQAARRGNVPAMRLLLEELRHDGDEAAPPSVIDELATKRRAPATID